MIIKLTKSKSRAMNTYGYDRVSALDLSSNRKYVAIGGGYDMVSTVIGDLVADKLQNIIKKLTPYYIITTNYELEKTNSNNAFYGLEFDTLTGKATINGSCGLSSVIKIIEACGYKLETYHTNRKRDSYLVLTKQEDQE